MAKIARLSSEQRENLTAVLAAEASLNNNNLHASVPEESIADTVIRLKMEDTLRSVSSVQRTRRIGWRAP